MAAAIKTGPERVRGTLQATLFGIEARLMAGPQDEAWELSSGFWENLPKG
jgi:hypothetical protein